MFGQRATRGTYKDAYDPEIPSHVVSGAAADRVELELFRAIDAFTEEDDTYEPQLSYRTNLSDERLHIAVHDEEDADEPYTFGRDDVVEAANAIMFAAANVGRKRIEENLLADGACPPHLLKQEFQVEVESLNPSEAEERVLVVRFDSSEFEPIREEELPEKDRCRVRGEGEAKSRLIAWAVGLLKDDPEASFHDVGVFFERSKKQFKFCLDDMTVTLDEVFLILPELVDEACDWLFDEREHDEIEFTAYIEKYVKTFKLQFEPCARHR